VAPLRKEKVMHKVSATFAIATLGIVIVCYSITPAEAQYQSQPSASCPAMEPDS
jgi:hypothetical protein